jgi:helix-turn-helix protein
MRNLNEKSLNLKGLQLFNGRILATELNNGKLMDNTEFIKFFGISKKTAQRWRTEDHRISYIALGKKVYYLVSDVEKMLAEGYVKKRA